MLQSNDEWKDAKSRPRNRSGTRAWGQAAWEQTEDLFEPMSRVDLIAKKLLEKTLATRLSRAYYSLSGRLQTQFIVWKATTLRVPSRGKHALML